MTQLSIGLLFAPSSTDRNPYYQTSTPRGWHFSTCRWMRLNNWDSFHYFETAERGYHLPVTPLIESDIHEFRATGGFFPGYPIATRFFHSILKIPTEPCLIGVAQLAALLFWIYFFLLCRLWKISSRHSLRVAAFALAYPASFFMIAGYSESLFMAGMLGLIYWTELSADRTQKARFGLVDVGLKFKIDFSLLAASLHGFVMCSTRILGVPIAFYPLIKAFFNRSKNIKIHRLTYGAVTAISLMGVFSFFLFSYFKFGRWDQYMMMQKLGWGHTPDYFAIFKPGSYLPRFFYEPEIISVNRSAVPVCMGLGLFLWVTEIKKNARNPRLNAEVTEGHRGVSIGSMSLEFYFPIFFLMYLSISAKANTQMDSLCRYSYGSFILLLLVILKRISEKDSILTDVYRKIWVRYGLFGLVILFLIFNGIIAYRFTHGKWVT